MKRVVTVLALGLTLLVVLMTALSTTAPSDASSSDHSSSPAEASVAAKERFASDWRHVLSPARNWTIPFKQPSWSPFSGSASKGAESYRDHLLSTTSPPGYSLHSRHLGFSKIFVLSLKQADARRAHMAKLARALDLDFTFFDATPADSDIVGWVGERVEDTRKAKVKAVSDVKVEEDERKIWTSTAQELDVNFGEAASFNGLDWHQYMDRDRPEILRAEDSAFFATLAEKTKDSTEQSRAEAIATWTSHVKLLKHVVNERLPNALVLEDDVDLEMDIDREWSLIRRRLPPKWDIVFLGHCWGRELDRPAYLHPKLHQSTEPKCMHAYAVSLDGARRITSHLADPWTAYQVGIDEMVSKLVKKGTIESYSVEPPLVIQAPTLASPGTKWRGILADSTLDRIRQDEGVLMRDPVHDPKNPAVILRTGLSAAAPQVPLVASDHTEESSGPEKVANDDVGLNEVDGDDGFEEAAGAKNPMAALPAPKAEPDAANRGDGGHNAHVNPAKPIVKAPAPKKAAPKNPPKQAGAAAAEAEAADRAAGVPKQAKPGRKKNKPLKVGTGGRVQGAEALAQGNANRKNDKAHHEAAGHAGKPGAAQAQAEAKQRIGTGARPAAQLGGKPAAKAIDQVDMPPVHVADVNAHRGDKKPADKVAKVDAAPAAAVEPEAAAPPPIPVVADLPAAARI